LQGDDTDVLGSNAEMEYAHCQAAVVKRATVKVNSMVGSVEHARAAHAKTSASHAHSQCRNVKPLLESWRLRKHDSQQVQSAALQKAQVCLHAHDKGRSSRKADTAPASVAASDRRQR
jgi:hypothetical protein